MDEMLTRLLGGYADRIEPDLASSLIRMSKAEIHVHLEGAIRPEIELKLAQRHDMLDSLPALDEEGLRGWFFFRDFPHFVEIYFAISDLIRSPEDLALIVYDNGVERGGQQALVDFGVEMRWIFDIPRNASFHNGKCRSQDSAYDPLPADRTLAYALQGMDRGVVGFGLGGYEKKANAR